MRDAIIQSILPQGKYRTNKKANEALSAAIIITSEENLNVHGLRRCRDAARKMEDALFSVGGAERISATLRYFKDQPSNIRGSIGPGNAHNKKVGARCVQDAFHRKGAIECPCCAWS